MGALAVRQALFWQVERKKPHAERAAGEDYFVAYISLAKMSLNN